MKHGRFELDTRGLGGVLCSGAREEEPRVEEISHAQTATEGLACQNVPSGKMMSIL